MADAPKLETKRLILTVPGPDRAKAALDYFDANRNHLEPWEPLRPDGFYTEPFWRERLALNRQELELGLSMRFFIAPRSSPKRFIGTCNFTNVIRGPLRACLLGYAIGQQEQGIGLMQEALGAAIPEVFKRLDLHRIMANYQPTNERSGRLLRRLGFVVEGYARDYLFIGGQWRDHVLTSLIHPDGD